MPYASTVRTIAPGPPYPRLILSQSCGPRVTVAPGHGASDLKRRHWLAAILIGVAVVLVLLWMARAVIAARFANSYFRQHGVESDVEIGTLGLSGASARFVLGPKN